MSDGSGGTASPHRPLPTPLRFTRAIVRGYRTTRLRVLTRGKLRVGKNVTFGSRAKLLSPQFVSVGDNVSVGADFHVEANLEIGSDVLISSRVAVIGNDHRFDDVRTTVYWAGRFDPATVRIDGDNLIGFGVTIVGPVTIGIGCIVGAGSVVTKDLPPFSVCVGVPARPIRARRRPTRS